MGNDFTRAAPGIRAPMKRNCLSVVFTVACALSAHCENYGEGLQQFGLVKTFEPTPLSDSEIGNPLRGLHGWLRDGTGQIVPAPLFDGYIRFDWSGVEDGENPGKFNFDPIDQGILTVANKGGCFGFRIMIYSPGTPTKIGVPAYVAKKGGGFTDNRGFCVPDWNSPYFLERVEALVKALGERYNRHPAISFVDIGIYGKWGEWHMFKVPYPGPHGEQDVTAENAQRIIDMHVKYFPDKWLLFRVNNKYAQYAMEKYPRMGCRTDGLANEPYMIWERKTVPWMADRWKRAPFIAETFSGNNPQTTVWSAAGHVVKYHVAMLGNGNLKKGNADLADGAEIAEFQRAGKLCGYRFELGAVGAPSVFRNGGLVSIVSKWRNSGVTPSYLKWDVNWQLRSPDNAVACQWTSGLDLTKSMPTKEHSLRIEDLLLVPPTLPPGEYTLSLTIEDPTHVRKPLTLAIKDEKAPDGSYTVGKVKVANPAEADRIPSPADAKSAVEKQKAALAEMQESAVVNYRDEPSSAKTNSPLTAPRPVYEQP
jgi:hypothetical protein